MRKLTTAALATCLTAMGLLSGCSGGQTATGGSESSNKDKVVHLKFWGAVPADAGPQKVVDNWNKAHPDIQVEYDRFVNDDSGNTKLETALLADGQVDLFMSYRMDTLVKRLNAGMAEPIDDFVKKDNFDLVDNFGKNSIVKFNDKTYYIPAIILNDFVELNKKKLDDAGLPIPKDWTWDDYKQYATKLTKGDGPNKVWGSFVGGPSPKIYEWADKAVKVALGPNILYKPDGTSNLDNPNFKKYLDVQVDLQNNLKVQPPFAEVKATKMQGNEVYLSGKTAMHWWGTASIRDIKDTKKFPHDFVTAFAPVPKLNKDDKYVTAGTGYLDFMSINSRSKNKDAAWKFMKWYVTEGNEPMISGGRVPSWKKVDKDKVVKLVLGDQPEKLFDVDSFKYVLFFDKDFIVDTKFDKMPEMQKIFEEEAEKAFLKEQTTDQATQNMKKRADKILAKK